MKSDRIAQLIKFLAEDPHDAFVKYGLAMEYLTDQPEESITWFTDLLINHPDYLPTYYQAAALYAEIGSREEAEEVYRKGIELAKKVNDRHSLAELQSAYQNFLMEE